MVFYLSFNCNRQEGFMSKQQQEGNQEAFLNLYDLLVDEKSNELSEYLSLSLKTLGNDTKVSITTIEDSPTTYSSIFNGISITGLQNLGSDNMDFVSE